MKLLAFCEAPADFRMASGLVDRVLRDVGPPWVAESLDTPDAVRTWHPDGNGQIFFDVHRLNEYADRLGVRTTRGHFNGQPGRPGAAMARKAFRVAWKLHRKTPDEPINLVILVWDADTQADGRNEGINDARIEAKRWAPFDIVCGLPDPESEAWILAGFTPASDDEHTALADLHQELGFSPVREAARLRDKTSGAPRDIKRVLGILTSHDVERQARCWSEPLLDTLRQHGQDTGLTVFLDDLAAALRPLLGVPANGH